MAEIDPLSSLWKSVFCFSLGKKRKEMNDITRRGYLFRVRSSFIFEENRVYQWHEKRKSAHVVLSYFVARARCQTLGGWLLLSAWIFSEVVEEKKRVRKEGERSNLYTGLLRETHPFFSLGKKKIIRHWINLIPDLDLPKTVARY